ncbi:MAG: tRNA uridine-5-carboxymethylaminomethyl(34) synthesis enzyme MnmG [Bacilli bacterium]|nr:tRNA uridine-5-carboxymethylaminomethyl(34) synthesis enzyme MnmG [Bacilli bacterium]
MEYEIIVVGGGHAGSEAALASARKGHKTLLITGNIKNIASLPCNPAIGGSAKGIIVREIDALGGEMGVIADKTHFQIKTLNKSKGPAVRALRAQVDKIKYPKEMLKTIKKEKNLNIKEGIVEDFILKENTILGVILNSGEKIKSKAVILTTGTYLKSNILIGSKKVSSGPDNEKNAIILSDNLKKYGFIMLRLKTDTPPRVKKKSIDFSKMRVERGENEYLTFSFDNKIYYELEKQEVCYLTYTNKKTHKIILDNLHRSSKYDELNNVVGIGPRYCPSIEDKIVRFKDKERHQLFLEPESKYNDDIYIQGLYNSMPIEIQKEIVNSIEGLENAIISKYAYAIEYDAIQPTQLTPTLETKKIKNLWTAGQINGTSGYEEAAAQGLIAGINASLKLEGKEPLILKRNEAYIGVLIDDIVTKGIYEPYRLLTSRAEYRLLLRDDNADLRLLEYGYKCGLINEEKYQKFLLKKNKIKKLTNELLNQKIKEYQNISLYNLLKRPEFDINIAKEKVIENYDKKIWEQVIINIKYEGYIKKSKKEAEKMLKNERKKIPSDIDYDKINNLATEARQKLKKIRPISIGQAMRISGVNPSDITMLTIYLRKYYKNE